MFKYAKLFQPLERRKEFWTRLKEIWTAQMSFTHNPKLEPFDSWTAQS